MKQRVHFLFLLVFVLVFVILSGCRGTTGSGGGTSDTITTGPAVEIKVEVTGAQTPISPFIYGTDKERVLFPSLYAVKARPTFIRAGGNDWTAYNWENNATNMGIDDGPNKNIGIDKFWEAPFEGSNKPGEAAVKIITGAHNLGVAALITVPITDYVAADKNGIVTEKTTDAGITRWVQNKDTKPGALSTTPSTLDGVVYQDEFVNFIQQRFKDVLSQGKKIFYSLDNEPALWPETHALLHPAKQTTYAEMADRTKRFGTAIKRMAPESLVFGAVTFGFSEMVTLQGAPDHQMGREYLDFYLDKAKELEASEGKRIVDVLDIHWYPEVQFQVEGKVEKKPIVIPTVGGDYFPQSTNPSKAEMEARMNAPRSLWDPAYIEDSSITTNYYGKPQPLRLIPWLKDKVAAHYPGTKLAITEYNYGDGYHVSHAIAQADVLGIFGREGLFAANLLPLYDAVHHHLDSYLTGAFDMYLNYDGKGSAVGDLSIPVQNPDVSRLSVYATKKTGDSNILHIVAINKTEAEIPVTVALTGGKFSTASAFALTKDKTTPQAAGPIGISNGNTLTGKLPPLSVTTIEVKK